uniref:Uncharacterized protein n=1 Tax=Myoviridae sp. ctqfO1 TaxID=2827710 RepID=A0A8S5T2T9_9CAUD|nr:MAG TPA: hypothetical protein [Myoviridae sp. ctqfO1]
MIQSSHFCIYITGKNTLGFSHSMGFSHRY